MKCDRGVINEKENCLQPARINCGLASKHPFTTPTFFLKALIYDFKPKRLNFTVAFTQN